MFSDLLNIQIKQNFQIFVISFSLLCLNLMNHSEIRKFYDFSLFNSLDLGFKSKSVFILQFLVDILPLGSGFVDPYIFADPADPDPKHWNKMFFFLFCLLSKNLV